MNMYLVIMTVAAFLLVYPYIVYPLLVMLLAKPDSGRTAATPTEWPFVSIVISFYNAHEAVQRKVENLLQLDYPKDRWEVIFVSDGVNDATVSYLNDLGMPRIKVLNLGERVGKTEAENRARSFVNGEIVVFTDCSTFLHKDVLRTLVCCFADPRVGAASTVDMISGDEGSVVKEGESAYVGQEMRLRKWETNADMMIGLSGSCYACRGDVFEIIAPETTRDLAAGLTSLRKGYVNVSAERAYCSIKTQSDIKKEFGRKVRTINNGVATVLAYRDMLNVFRYGRASFAIFSHKILRWMSFPWLMVILFTSVCGLNGLAQQVIVGGQLSIYACAVVFYFSERILPFSLVRIGVKFVIACFAAFVAVIEILLGKRYATWKPTNR
jgi:cellulose synthase/poly-beta-1,6-N-acetylglucosamine synthase-like glycosyltransferase